MERLLTLYSEVQSTDVRWLWYPFIAIGKITLLQGDPGDGKSTMMMNLIAELSTGGKTPDGCKIGAPQKVIYQCSEDGVSDTIKPRLERCGADCKKIAFINQGSAVLDETEREAGTTSVPIPQGEDSENTPLPDLPEQPENVQRPGSEVVEKGMLT